MSELARFQAACQASWKGQGPAVWVWTITAAQMATLYAEIAGTNNPPAWFQPGSTATLGKIDYLIDPQTHQPVPVRVSG